MSEEYQKGYNQGKIDGIKLWGEACGRQGNCSECPIGSIRGAGVTCQEFARQFPAKMLSIMTEMQEGQITYYEEYCTRFPNSAVPVEVLAQIACRKAVFEGYLDCKSEDCLRCWNEKYITDVTMDQSTGQPIGGGNNDDEINF